MVGVLRLVRVVALLLVVFALLLAPIIASLELLWVDAAYAKGGGGGGGGGGKRTGRRHPRAMTIPGHLAAMAKAAKSIKRTGKPATARKKAVAKSAAKKPVAKKPARRRKSAR